MKNLLFILFLIPFLGFSQKKDSLYVPFPEKYHLALKNNQQDDKQIFREWIPENQTWENYSIIVTSFVLKNGKNLPLDLYKNLTIKGLKEKTKGFKYTEIERYGDENNGGYLIFKSEAESYKDSNDKESQIYYLTKGKNDFFVYIVALKTNYLPEDFVKEWTNVYKKSKFIE